MALKIKYSDVGPLLFMGMCIVLYSIPDNVQLPFRLLIFLGLIGGYLNNKSLHMPVIQFLIFCITAFIVLSKIVIGTFDTSLLMVFLSIIPIMNIDTYTSFSQRQMRVLRYIIYFLCFAIVGQLLIYRYEGRPNLSYEINQSGSYLFLFFLLCDLFKIRLGKILVICASFLLLSRLLILAIATFYLITIVNKFFPKILRWFTYTKLILLANICIVLFSFVFFLIFTRDEISTTTNDASRLVNVVDGSNMLRFRINVNIIIDLFDGDRDLLYKGYGDMAINSQYVDRYILMPHNEMLKGGAQFGFIFMLFFFLVTRKYYSQYVNRKTLTYFIPIVLYTLILWVRFTIIPSFEMIFILFILKLKCDENNFCFYNHYKLCCYRKSGNKYC